MSNIRVAVRVRPLNEKEKQDGSKDIVAVKGNSVTIENVKVLGIPEFGDSRSRYKEFLFDHCYNSMQTEAPYTTQGQVFEDLGSSVLKSAHDGFNACVFAYGQTGTGKTHTMMGYQNDPGLIPRICEGLFPHVANDEGSHISYRVDISYFEIYNEKVRDLLQPFQFQQNPKFSLKVRNHPRDGPYVEGLSWHRVKDNDEIQALINKGNEFRVTAETYIHDRSSRSHAIVTVCFTQARLEQNRPSEIVSKINLVDLAGSERADPSSKPDFRKRLTEGSNINRSLVTLGYIIKALAERSLLSWDTEEVGSAQTFSSNGGGESIASNSPSGPSKQRLPFIPYRDSVLTWLLKDSLGGNSKTIMIATITPASQYYSETLSTLRYAQRAKNIINKPRINEDGNVALIRELRREIGRLHEMLADAKKGGNLLSLPDSEDAIIAEKLHENEEMAKQLTESWMCKWSSTHDIMKESDLSIRGLRNRSSSMGVMIDSQLPYLIGMDDDKLSTGVVIFHLKEGETFVGRDGAERPQDIVLIGPNILTEHCTIRNVNGEVTLVPNPGSMCLVQGQECVEPTKLSQGDYVVLGGDQVFRFNNPTEAAKLREHRRSQGSLNTLNTSHLSFGGLSRASSYSSIGGDDHSSLSPYSQLGRSYPNYAAPDLCLELEKRHQSEKERIDLARQELDQLRQEHERAEEVRQEKEEEMYMQHEQHKQDLEDQKQHLARLIAENERAREKAEEELSHARESLAKEKEAFQKELDAERKRLKELENTENQQKLKSSGFQTDSPSTTTTSTGADTETQPDDDECPPRAKLQRRMSVEEQLKELEQNEFTRRMSYRETEQSLSIQEEDIEDQYLHTQDQIQAKIRQIRQVEEEYKELDKTHLLEINTQAEKLKELHKKEAQLEVYIQEKEELINVGTEAPTHLRNASSELYLAGQTLEVSTYCEQKTSSLQDIQTCLKEEADQGVYSPRSLNRSASAESLESGAGDIGESSKTTKKMDDKVLNRSKKDFNITGTAKDVTSRLYKPPEPKFKYVPKTHEKEVKPVARTRVTRDRNVDQHARGSPSRSVSDINKGNSPSPSRFIRESSKSHSPSPKRQIQRKHGSSPGLTGDRLNKSDPKKKPKQDDDKKTKTGTKAGPVKSDPKQGKNIPGRNQSPSSTKTGGKSPDKSPTISPVGGKLGASGKLRQMASASSLASVPESLCEGNDDIGQGLDQSQTLPVIKKRNRRGRASWDDDEFRTHSAPDSQTMASALDKYTEEMNALQSSGRIVRDSVIPNFNTSVSVDESQLVSPGLSREIDKPTCEMEIQSGDEMISDTKSGIHCDNETSMNDEDLVILSGNLRNNSEGLQNSESKMVLCDELEEDTLSYNDDDMVDNRTVLGKREYKHDSGEIFQDPDKDVLPLKKAKPSNEIDFKSDGKSDKNHSCSEDSLDLSDDSLERGSNVRKNKQLKQRLPRYLFESNKHSSEDSFNDSLENQSSDERDTNHDGEISSIQRNDVEMDASGGIIKVLEGSIIGYAKGDAVTKDVLDNDKTVYVDPLETSVEKQDQSVVSKTGKLAFSKVVCHDNIDLIEKDKAVPSEISGIEQQSDTQEAELQNQGLDRKASDDGAENKCVYQNINSHSTKPDQNRNMSSTQPDQNQSSDERDTNHDSEISSVQRNNVEMNASGGSIQDLEGSIICNPKVDAVAKDMLDDDKTVNVDPLETSVEKQDQSDFSKKEKLAFSKVVCHDNIDLIGKENVVPSESSEIEQQLDTQESRLQNQVFESKASVNGAENKHVDQTFNLHSTWPDQNRSLSSTHPDQNRNLSSTQPDQHIILCSIQPDQNTGLSSTQPNQNTSLSSTQPDKNRSLSSTQLDQNRSLSSTQPDQNISLSSTHPDQHIKLSSTQPDQNTNLSSTQPDQNTSLSSTKHDQNTNLSSTQPDQKTSLNSSQPDQKTSLSSTQPDQNKSLSSTHPDKKVNLSSTHPDQITNLDLTQPDQNINACSLSLNHNQKDTTLLPNDEVDKPLFSDEVEDMTLAAQDVFGENLTLPISSEDESYMEVDGNNMTGSKDISSVTNPVDVKCTDSALEEKDKPADSYSHSNGNGNNEASVEECGDIKNDTETLEVAKNDYSLDNSTMVDSIQMNYVENEPMETNSLRLIPDKTVNDPKDYLVKNQESSDIRQCTVETFEKNEKPNEISNTTIASSLNFAEEQQLRSLGTPHPECVQTDFRTTPISIQPSIVTEERFTVDTVMPEVRHYVEEVIAGAHQQCIQNDSEIISEMECEDDDVEKNCLDDDLAQETISDVEKPFTESDTPLKRNQIGQIEGMLPTDRTQGEDSKNCLVTNTFIRDEAKDSKLTSDESLAPSQSDDTAGHESEDIIVSKMNFDVNPSLNQENGISTQSTQQQGNLNAETSDDVVKGVSDDKDDLQSKTVSLFIEEPKYDDNEISEPTNIASDPLQHKSDLQEENQSKPAIKTMSVEEPLSDDEDISVPTYTAGNLLYPHSDLKEDGKNQSKHAIPSLSDKEPKSDEDISVPINSASTSLQPNSDLSEENQSKPAMVTMSVEEPLSDVKDITVPTNSASDSLHPNPDLSEENQSKPAMVTMSVEEPLSDVKDIPVPTNSASDSLHPYPDLSEENQSKPAMVTMSVEEPLSDVKDITVPTNSASDSLHPNPDLSEESQSKPAMVTMSVEEPLSDVKDIPVPTNTADNSLHPRTDLSEDRVIKSNLAIAMFSVEEPKSDDKDISVPSYTASDSLHPNSDLNENGENPTKPATPRMSVEGSEIDGNRVRQSSNMVCDSLDNNYHPIGDIDEDDKQSKPAVYTDSNNNLTMEQSCELELTKELEDTWESEEEPKTRTIGICTSPGFLESLEDNEDSNGSLIDPDDELQVLQEALDQLPERPAPPGPQLSTARRAARQRAMIRQKLRAGDSDGVGQLSDEPDNPNKSSSRPDSGSRRRKRPTTTRNSRANTEHTSDDYDSSENDSTYSEDSGDNIASSVGQNGIISQTNGSSVDVEGLIRAEVDTDCVENQPGEEMLSRHLRKKHERNSLRQTQQCEESAERESEDGCSRSVGVQTFDRHPRGLSSSSVRTDLSDLENSFASGEFGAMVISPVSVWNSNNRADSPCDRNSSSSSGIIKTLSDSEKSLLQTQRSSSRSNASFISQMSNLDRGPTEVWSSSISDLQHVPRFEDDLLYVMETEMMSPGASSIEYQHESQSQQPFVMPVSHDDEQCVDRPDCSTPRSGRNVDISFPESQIQQVNNLDPNTPVTFEVTIHENNTNVLYNVDKTEYRTYAGRNQDVDREPGIIPDSIHVNIRENVTSRTQESYESHTTESVHLRNDSSAGNDGNDIVLERSYRSSYSSECDIDAGETKPKQVTSRREEVDESRSFILPEHIRDQNSEKRKNVQLQSSGLLGTTNYTDFEKPPTEEDHNKSLEDKLDESECTSDYGTITSIDGRKGFLSFSSDSEDGSPRSSPHLSLMQGTCTSDLGSSFAALDEESLHAHHQDMRALPAQGQGVCSVENIESPAIAIASTTAMSLPALSRTQLYEVRHGHVDEDDYFEQAEEILQDLRPAEVSSDEETKDDKPNACRNEDDLDTETSSVSIVRPNDNVTSQETLAEGEVELRGSVEKLHDQQSLENGDFAPEKDNMPARTDQIICTQQQTDQTPSYSSADDSFLSLEQSETSSCSSDYRTPQQSPIRFLDTGEASSQVEEVFIPDTVSQDIALATTPRFENMDSIRTSQPVNTSSPKRPANVRTVSVNTDSSSNAATPVASTVYKLPSMFKTDNDPGQIEAKRKEIKTKITKLEYQHRSLSDSAISSDFTDGDSVSLSPRGSKQYEFDKSISGEKRLKFNDGRDTIRHSPMKVNRAINFDGPVVKRVPFNDSGNVYDQEHEDGERSYCGDRASIHLLKNPSSAKSEPLEQTKRQLPVSQIDKFPESIIDASLALKPFPIKRSSSLDSLATLVNTGTSLSRAVREPIMPDNVDGSIEEEEKNVSVAASGTDDSFQSIERSLSPGEIITDFAVDDMDKKDSPTKVQAKSTSFSHIQEDRNLEYRRSLSEGDVENLDGSLNASADSNDSITFVFVGKEFNNGEEAYDVAETVYDDSEYNPCGSGRDPDSESQSMDSINGEKVYTELDPVNISGRGYPTPDSSVNYEPVLSRSASGDSVICQVADDNIEDDNCDQWSSHSASEEIEEIIVKGNHLQNFIEPRDISDQESREMSVNGSTESSITTTENVKDYKAQLIYGGETSPLRHRFGIDEKVLPISERSVSADNIPRQLSGYKDIQRSRSTGMLDVGVVEEQESESGIFPPAHVAYDEDQTDPSFSLRTMSENGLDQISQRTVSEIGASLSNRSSSGIDTSTSNSMSSARVRSVCSAATSSAESLYEEIVINYSNSKDKKRKRFKQGPDSTSSEGEIDIQSPEESEAHIQHVLDTVKRFIFPKPTLIDRGVSSEVTDEPTLVSIGIQTSVEDVRDSVEVSNSSINRLHNILPALAAPFRAQSMDSFGLGTGAEQLQLSDGSISWVEMSELMVETTHLLRSINDRLPDMDRNSSISSTDESQAILKQWEEISIQTGKSLTNLNTVGLQTDELAESETDSRNLDGAQDTEPIEKSDEFTQVDMKFRMEPLDTSNITLTELSSEVIQVISYDVSVQTDIDTDLVTESFIVGNAYLERTAADRSNSDSFTPNSNTESQNKNDGNIPVTKSEGTLDARKPKSNTAASAIDSCEKESNLVGKVTDRQQQLTERSDGKFISQTKSDLGFNGTKVDKGIVGNGDKMKSGDGVKEEPLPPGFTLPNTKEIDDLRKEHAKLMDNLRKASEMRQSRKDKIQSRKQFSNEFENETGDLNSNGNNVHVHEQIEVCEVGPGRFLNDDGTDAVLPVSLGEVDENRDIAISNNSLGGLPNENKLAPNGEKSQDIENSELNAEDLVCENGDEMVLPNTKEKVLERDQELEDSNRRDESFNNNDENIDQENVHIEITETGRGVFIQETHWIVGPCSFVPYNENNSKKIEEGPAAAKPESHVDSRKTKDDTRLEKSSVDYATDIIEEFQVGQGIFIDELGNKVELPVDSTDVNSVSNFVESTESDLSSKDKQENVHIEIIETGKGVFIQESDKWIVGPCSYIPAEEHNEASKVEPTEREDKEKSDESSDSQDLVKINIQVDPTTGLKIGKQSSKPVVTNDDKAPNKDHAKQHKHTWKLQGDEMMAISDEKPVSTSSYERIRSESDASLSSVDTNASSEIAITMAGKGNNPDLLSGQPGAFNPVISDDDLVDDVLGDDIVTPQKTKKSDSKERKLDITQEKDAIIPMNYSRSETIPKRHLSSTPTSLGPEEQNESREQGHYNNILKCESSPKLPSYSRKSASPVSNEETADQDVHSDTSLETVNESFTEIIETKPKRLPVFKNVSPLSLFEREINSNTNARDKPESPEMFENISPEKVAMFPDEIDAKSDSSLETVNESFTEIIETKPKRLPNFKALSPSSSFNIMDNSPRQDFPKTTAKTFKDGSCLPMKYHDVQIGSGMKHSAPLFGKSDDATQVSMEFSDDFTQTDNDNETPVIQPAIMGQTKVLPTQATSKTKDKRHTVGSQQSRSGPSEKLKEDLEKLQQERLHILDLLGLSYLPTSLTVELLEAKLNYCIGQTDLLLNNVEDEVSISDTSRSYTQEQQRVVDYISIYRSDLKKSKQDIKECREKLNSSKKPGVGRGRTSVRKRDVFNNQRQAFIDAFKLERMREQNDYDSSRHGTPVRGNTPLKGNTPLRGNTPLIGNSPVVTPRSERSRSSSPTYTTGYMTPREHKEHLVDLRRQLIRDITEEELRHRSASPLNMSHTSPPSHHHHRFTSPPQSHVGFTPKVSTPLSNYPDHSHTKYNTYTPGIHDVLGVPRSTSLDGIRPHSHHSSISPPRRYEASYGRHVSPPSHFDTRMAAESLYPPQDSAQIMREIEEIKQRSSMSAPLEEMLRRSSFSSSGSHRSNSSRAEGGISPRTQSDPRPLLSRPRHTSPERARFETPLSLNLDSLQDDTQGPYSPYSAYAREHIIPNERSYGGVLRGSYQLYESPHDRSDTSSNLSYGSDTHSDTGHYQGLDEERVKRLRPVKSSDIKARIGRHKR